MANLDFNILRAEEDDIIFFTIAETSESFIDFDGLVTVSGFDDKELHVALDDSSRESICRMFKDFKPISSIPIYLKDAIAAQPSGTGVAYFEKRYEDGECIELIEIVPASVAEQVIRWGAERGYEKSINILPSLKEYFHPFLRHVLPTSNQILERHP
jgi:hypothetical protein